MGLTIAQISISLDGFVAGPNQSLDDPIGEGGMRLHQWLFETNAWSTAQGLEPRPPSPDDEAAEDLARPMGAFIMGRHMFGGGTAGWDPSWRGWWGENPPYHAPVFVLTHHAREPLPMEGGTTFYFVTDGIDSAYAQAKKAAGDKDIRIAGGAQAIQQFIRARRLEELTLDIAPILLGAGERLLENVGDPVLSPVKVIAAARATHVKYRIEYK